MAPFKKPKMSAGAVLATGSILAVVPAAGQEAVPSAPVEERELEGVTAEPDEAVPSPAASVSGWDNPVVWTLIGLAVLIGIGVWWAVRWRRRAKSREP